MPKVSNDAAGLHAAAAKIAGRRVHTGRQNGGRSVVMVDHRVRRTAWFAAVLALGCALLIAGKAAAAGKDAKPVATIQLKEGSVAVGIGYSWGKGVLTYRGKRYPFKIDGLTAGELGGATITARGEVYYLKKLADFSGNYTSVGAGATAAGGYDVESMRNANGVEIKMISTTRGADLRAAVEGVKITLEP